MIHLDQKFDHRHSIGKRLDAVGIEPTTTHMLGDAKRVSYPGALLVDVLVMLLLRHL
jgi:hypothetical protein